MGGDVAQAGVGRYGKAHWAGHGPRHGVDLIVVQAVGKAADLARTG
jgi:hypothetical protein